MSVKTTKVDLLVDEKGDKWEEDVQFWLEGNKASLYKTSNSSKPLQVVDMFNDILDSVTISKILTVTETKSKGKSIAK